MKVAALLACILFLLLFSVDAFGAEAAGNDPAESELYEFSGKKTVFQNLRDWFGIWGKGFFSLKENGGAPENESTLKRNLRLKEQDISKPSK